MNNIITITRIHVYPLISTLFILSDFPTFFYIRLKYIKRSFNGR